MPTVTIRDNYRNEEGYKWPEVFEKGTFTYTDKKQAITDAYSGWGICSAGAGGKIPKNFGEGMACIGKFLGISPTVDNLDKMVKELEEKT